jgi:hypothetical protein
MARLGLRSVAFARGPQVIACASCGTLAEGPTSVQGIAVWLVIGAVAGVGFLVNRTRRKAGKPPISPMSNISPGTRSLLSGRNIPAYTAKVTAITPTGVTVRQARCCAARHQLPEQAVAHANAIKRRIETTGR